MNEIMTIQRIWRGCMGRIKARVFKNCFSIFDRLTATIGKFFTQHSYFKDAFNSINEFAKSKGKKSTKR